MSLILVPAAVLGGMGVLFGVGLAIANKKLGIEKDPREVAVRNALPGANCGGCGFAGCDAFAAAVLSGNAKVNGCPVGGVSCSEQIAGIMGVDAGGSKRWVSTVVCRGATGRCKEKYVYKGIEDCRAAALAADGYKACRFACLGLGTCAKSCEYDAIHMENELAVIDKDKCVGCQKCVAVCPKSVLQMMPDDRPIQLRCRANARGRMVKDLCDAGCIACTRCAKACKFGAIEMKDNLPVISIEKCVGCMECARVCPSGAIEGDVANRPVAKIDSKDCIGCEKCKAACRFNAIEGESKGDHVVIHAECTGCGECVRACPQDCIAITERTK